MNPRFTFAIDDHDAGSSWDLGHLTIHGAGAVYTSQGATPSQAMMIYPSLTHLIQGLVPLLSSSRQVDGFDFHATDSSFFVRFRHMPNQRAIRMESADGAFSLVLPAQTLAAELLRDAEAFWQCANLDPSEPIYRDVCDAMDRLREAVQSLAT